MAEEDAVVVEVSPEETSARALGWKPLEEYEGPEEKWVDAHEFVSRQPLFEKIDSLKSELWKTKQEHQKEFAQIKQHFNTVKDTEFKRAIDYLKSQKIEAVEAGDAKLVIELDDRIDELKDQRAAEVVASQPAQPTGPDPAFVEWIEGNSWYTQDAELRGDADAFAMSFARQNPQAPLVDILKHVDKKMKQVRQSGTPSVAAVESNTNTVSTQKGKTKFSEEILMTLNVKLCALW